MLLVEERNGAQAALRAFKLQLSQPRVPTAPMRFWTLVSRRTDASALCLLSSMIALQRLSFRTISTPLYDLRVHNMITVPVDAGIKVSKLRPGLGCSTFSIQSEHSALIPKSPAWTHQNNLKVSLGGSSFVNLDEAHTLVLSAPHSSRLPSESSCRISDMSNLSLAKVAQSFNSEIYLLCPRATADHLRRSNEGMTL